MRSTPVRDPDPIRSRASVLLTLLALLVACTPKDPSPAPPPSATPSASAANTPPSPPRRDTAELLGRIASCEVRHRGLLLDLGTPAARARRSFRIDPLEDTADTEREGATVSRILVPRISYELTLDEPLEESQLSLRIFGSAARAVTAIVDDRRLGSVKLSSPELKIVDFPLQKTALAAGRHTLTLSFSGRARGSTEALAEVDWVRLGPPIEPGDSYAAPTLKDLVTDVVLDGVPRRAIALRAPASVRCALFLAPDARLSSDLGFWGDGKGVADVRVIADGEAPTVLAERKLTGGTGATWTNLELPLKEHSGRLVALELRALESSKGGRVLFGDPSLFRNGEAPSVPEATTVVLVVSSGTDRRLIPPWGPVGNLPSMGELARSSVAYSGYRAPSTVPAAVMGSLLTREPPGVHALEDPAARLPKAARTLGELLKEASGRTAMFTGAPTTFAAFGFDAGWDRYVPVSPVADQEATQPLAAAAKWLENELGEEPLRRLVVVHARGAHPPWDVSREETTGLPPEEYGGLIDPRRGGPILARLRGQKRNHKKLADEDWTRMKSLIQVALSKQDAAIGQLVSVLKKKGAWDSTLFVFVGDVAPGEPPDVPFDPAGELREERLVAPLIVKFPGGRWAAKEVHSMVSSVDVATTILRALRLDSGRTPDLVTAADGVEPLAGRAFIASLGDRYTTRFGEWLLWGVLGKTPSLCQLEVDPTCMNDTFATRPVAGFAAWQATYEALSSAAARRIAPREPASIDPDTGAALTVWGDI